MDQISLVVEGDGDLGALPVLIRAHLHSQEIFDIAPGKPLNTKGRGNLLRTGEVERFTRLAALQAHAVGVLVLCDADDDPACTLGPALQTRAETAAQGVPVRTSLAVKKFENWIVASPESVAGEVLSDVDDFEKVSAYPIVRRWQEPRSYVKPIHQPKLAAAIDLPVAAQRCPSLQRLLRCIDELVASRDP